jgi:hypothetical protein
MASNSPTTMPSALATATTDVGDSFPARMSVARGEIGTVDASGGQLEDVCGGKSCSCSSEGSWVAREPREQGAGGHQEINNNQLSLLS